MSLVESVGRLELSVVLPCLDEAETLGACIRDAQSYFARAGVLGEVVVADNGSQDGSPAIAEALGARVVHVPVKGYGAALMGGFHAAAGRFVVMADADGTYDLGDLAGILAPLRDGHDLVMGNRFRGGIAAGAMPALHRYLGNPVLSAVGRLMSGSRCGDFHCGLRAFRREAIIALPLRATGMEFASEMIMCAALGGLRITEVPTTLSPGPAGRVPHLRRWRDGWRHLRLMLALGLAPAGLRGARELP